MTAALIFRRQLVRHKPDLLTANSEADKLPLEKFHRLLDLVFWGKFLKLNSISLFVLGSFTGYHATRRAGGHGRGGRPVADTLRPTF